MKAVAEMYIENVADRIGKFLSFVKYWTSFKIDLCNSNFIMNYVPHLPALLRFLYNGSLYYF